MTSNSPPFPPQPPWDLEDWIGHARTWAADRMGQIRQGPGSDPEVIHRTHWSTVLKLLTDGQPIFLKAVTQPFRHEIPLTEMLAREFPAISPVVLASDIERGWLLMESGGHRLREAVRDSQIADHWLRLLPAYAGLQLDLGARADQLLGMGVPDRGAASLAQEYGGLIEDAVRDGSATDEALTKAEVERLRSLAPQIHSTLDLLSSSPVAESLDHGDMHDGNVFSNRGTYSFFDWGDAGVSFPFFSLRTLEVSLENRLGEPGLLAARPALREAYLRPWVDRGRLGWADGRDLLAAAEQVWSIAAAVRWRRAIRTLFPNQQKDYAHVLPSLLREVIQAAGDRDVH